MKQKQKADYDRRQCVRDLSPLAPDDYVWVHAYTQDQGDPGQVIYIDSTDTHAGVV